jgi:histidinol-phosphate/aromatic aminotransferase/cobyric acid decarboxylase-like protein
MITQKAQDLVDRGFDSDFGSSRIDQLFGAFGSESRFQDLIDQIHEKDRTIDMKRGEFYPEILRCIASMKRALANAYGIDPRQAHPSFGTNGSIDTIMMAMKLREINRGSTGAQNGGMLVATPTYFRNYNSCASKQMKMIAIPLRVDDWQIDVLHLLDALTIEKPTVVFLVTPNNPTGLAIPDENIIQILDAIPDDVLAVIDRTLVNITPEMGTAELLNRFKHKRVAVLHSLSKYAGMSHLRVGYALYSQLTVAEEVRPLLPLGLGVEGAVKATRLLVAHGPLQPQQRVIENIRASKQILGDFCSRHNAFLCTDFVANYCLLCLPPRLLASYVVSKLIEQGIYVMGGNELPEPRADLLRIHTGGRPQYMERLVAAMEELM